MDIKCLLSLLTPLYHEHQVVVKAQRKGCQKGGHYKIKTQGDLIVSKEIAIDIQDNQAGMIYTLIHETTHMYKCQYKFVLFIKNKNVQLFN